MTMGGLSFESMRSLGLGVDNVLQFEVMKMSGEVINVDENLPHRDLFKAMRGGGCGFGLILSMVIKLHPGTQVQKYEFKFSDPHKWHIDYSKWYKAVVKYAFLDNRWTMQPFLKQGNSKSLVNREVVSGTVALFFLGTDAEAKSHEIWKAFNGLLKEAPAENREYKEQGWPTYAEYKYESRVPRGEDEQSAPPFNWIIPQDFFLDVESAAKFLEEHDDGSLVPGCDAGTWGYHFGGKIAENSGMASDQTSGIARRKAGVLAMACDVSWLNKIAAKFPSESWSYNHYPWGEVELLAPTLQKLGKDFVDVTWGAEDYKFLLKQKMEIDPEYKFMCAYGPAWPPITQRSEYRDILSKNYFYEKTLSLKDAKNDVSPLYKTFASPYIEWESV